MTWAQVTENTSGKGTGPFWGLSRLLGCFAWHTVDRIPQPPSNGVTGYCSLEKISSKPFQTAGKWTLKLSPELVVGLKFFTWEAQMCCPTAGPENIPAWVLVEAVNMACSFLLYTSLTTMAWPLPQGTHHSQFQGWFLFGSTCTSFHTNTILRLNLCGKIQSKWYSDFWTEKQKYITPTNLKNFDMFCFGSKNTFFFLFFMWGQPTLCHSADTTLQDKKGEVACRTVSQEKNGHKETRSSKEAHSMVWLILEVTGMTG